MKDFSNEGTYVDFEGETYFVEGEWVPHTKSTWLEPAEGGYFNDFRIYNYAGVDITAELTAYEASEILKYAEETLLEEVG